jgi:hypothetical protein
MSALQALKRLYLPTIAAASVGSIITVVGSALTNRNNATTEEVRALNAELRANIKADIKQLEQDIKQLEQLERATRSEIEQVRLLVLKRNSCGFW